MSQENVEAARGVIEAFNRRDLDAYLALMDPAVEITPRMIGQGSYRGHEGVLRYWHELFRTLPDFTIEIVEIQNFEDVVLLGVRIRGHGMGSDAPFEEAAWATAKARHGKCLWWRAHSSKAEALEAVGLSE
jgi:ketosteroid isomerase-like protein